jgi:glycogen debranching enzyme
VQNMKNAVSNAIRPKTHFWKRSGSRWVPSKYILIHLYNERNRVNDILDIGSGIRRFLDKLSFQAEPFFVYRREEELNSTQAWSSGLLLRMQNGARIKYCARLALKEFPPILERVHHGSDK